MNEQQVRAVLDVLTRSIEQESVATRKVLAAVPNHNRDYRPDPKSRTAWELATHLAMADMWFADSILNGAFEWKGGASVPAEMTSTEAIAAWHERHLTDRLAKLRAMSHEHLVRTIDFFGTRAPAVTWLSMMNNHSIHHRGQLAAYLRAAGSKVPAIYGASADENLVA